MSFVEPQLPLNKTLLVVKFVANNHMLKLGQMQLEVMMLELRLQLQLAHPPMLHMLLLTILPHQH